MTKSRVSECATDPFRMRRRIFVLLTLVLGLLVAELIARAGLYLAGEAAWEQEQHRLAENGLALEDRGEVLHPYVGIAIPPATAPPQSNDPVHGINSLGFPHTTPPVQQRSSDRLLVGIVGGSAARQFADQGRRRLIQRLAASPQLAGREIQVICLAIEGFKQPQQLMAVSYVLALGGEFDVVVNLDGFNELVVADGNYEVGANTAYPRSWRFAATENASSPAVEGAWRVQEIRQERQALARRAQSSVWRFLALRQVLWRIEDLQLRNEQRRQAATATPRGDTTVRDFRVLGPQEQYSGDTELLRRIVGLWEAGSRQLMHLARGEDFLYLHCLQPTAHLPAKPLSPSEQEFVSTSSERQSFLIHQGYPLLRSAGQRLAADGENFIDVTDVFADVAETVYLDPCHLNQHGNELLADRISVEIVARLGQRPSLLREAAPEIPTKRPDPQER